MIKIFHTGVGIGGVGGACAPPTPPKYLVLGKCIANKVLYAIALTAEHCGIYDVQQITCADDKVGDLSPRAWLLHSGSRPETD